MITIDPSLKKRIDRAFMHLEQYGVHKGECIVVGSTIAAIISERIPGDIDLAVSPDVYKKLISIPALKEKVIPESGTLDLDQDFQVLLNRYADIRISDRRLFQDSNLQMNVSGYQFAIFEVEMAKKISRNYDKDLTDIDHFIAFAKKVDTWHWHYLDLAKPFSHKELIRRGLKRFFQNPIVAIRKVQDVLVHKLSDGLNGQLKISALTMPMIDVGVLIQLQSKNGVLNRYDVIVRKLLADAVLRDGISEVSKLEESPELQLYDTMQKNRTGRVSKTRYLRLLQDLSNHGHDLGRYPIYLNKHGHIYDGSHRVACAISMNNYNIPVKRNRFLSVEPQYARDWFINKISKNQLDILDNEEKNIQLHTGAAFKLMLWPPATSFSDEVSKIINDQHKIIHVNSNIDIRNFDKFVDDIYCRDGIAQWKIERKKRYFQNHETKVTVFSIIVEHPQYFRNSSTGSYLSNEMIVLKKVIRDKFKNQVPDYFGDVICHSSDNPQMSREMHHIIEDYKIKNEN
jgi:hypothetical protein